MTDPFGDGWMFVAGTNASADEALINEALLAAPASVRDGGEILPRRQPDTGMCRLCRTEGLLTRDTCHHSRPATANVSLLTP